MQAAISPHGTNGGMPAYPEIDETYLALAEALAPLGLAYLYVADHGYGKNPALASLELALRKT